MHVSKQYAAHSEAIPFGELGGGGGGGVGFHATQRKMFKVAEFDIFW